MLYRPSEDPAFVLLRTADGKTTGRVPVGLATTSYLLGSSEGLEDGDLVMFSLCVRKGHEKSMVACVRRPQRKGRRGRKVVWPEWNPDPAPKFFGGLPLHEWVSLPVPGLDCKDLLSGWAEERTRQEVEKNRQINDRCQEIKEDGQDESYAESLGYYITLRVKLAYLLLNREGIEKRKAQVENCIANTRAALLSAPQDLARRWTVPTTLPIPDEISDPNALVVPQDNDYEL